MEIRPIGIHTICYQPGMADAVDPGFLPLDVTADPQPDRRETAHMLNFWRNGLHRNYRVSGLLSPNFAERTGFIGDTFNAFIRNDPDFDVWFVNPRPSLFYLSYNIWEQGEAWHPGLCERASRVFKAANVAIDPNNFPRSTRNTLLFCNYWAGTREFWDQFMPFMEKIAMQAELTRSIEDAAFYSPTVPTSYWPFLFERLFTTFLVMRPDIRARYIQFDIDHILKISPHSIETLLIREWAPMIDRWDAVGIYNDDQRAIFRGLQKLDILGFLRDDRALQRTLLGV